MTRLSSRSVLLLRVLLSLVAIIAADCALVSPALAGLSDIIAETQPKVVKIYGAGGFQGLEAYQSGMLISGEGHILTV